MPPEMGVSANADGCVRDCRSRSSLGGRGTGVAGWDDEHEEDFSRLHRSRSSIGEEMNLSKELAARRRRIGFWRHPIVTLR